MKLIKESSKGFFEDFANKQRENFVDFVSSMELRTFKSISSLFSLSN